MNDELVGQYKDICNKIADVINKHLFDSEHSYRWVSDRIGGVCDFGISSFLTVEDMILILENNMSKEEFFEWNNANLKHVDYISLYSWLQGCRHNLVERWKRYMKGDYLMTTS